MIGEIALGCTSTRCGLGLQEDDDDRGDNEDNEGTRDAEQTERLTTHCFRIATAFHLLTHSLRVRPVGSGLANTRVGGCVKLGTLGGRLASKSV